MHSSWARLGRPAVATTAGRRVVAKYPRKAPSIFSLSKSTVSIRFEESPRWTGERNIASGATPAVRHQDWQSGSFLREESERFAIPYSVRRFHYDSTSTNTFRASALLTTQSSCPLVHHCSPLPPRTLMQNCKASYSTTPWRDYAGFKTDYDEWYSHGCTGGETRESRSEYHEGVVHTASPATLLNEEDVMGAFESAGLATVMDDQDPYNDLQETLTGGVQQAYATIVDDYYGLLEDQDDAFIELEEDMWILHGRSLDADEMDEDSDSSLDY